MFYKCWYNNTEIHKDKKEQFKSKKSLTEIKLYFDVKGNAQFIFLCNPQKSGASRVYVTILQITQKILTKDIFHWLELITEMLSFLQILSESKTTTPLF